MIWRDDELKNPFSGKMLKRDSPHSFTDGATRFPVVAEIPFLRAGRESLRHAVLQKLDAGDETNALKLLLTDRDDWATGDAPTAADLEPLFENENLTLRDAMQCLRYGAVADYFAYRWSDPTFLSGLCLLEHHLPHRAKTVFELCCGIGHYLREFALRGIEATGADVVFSKLWLTRRFVAAAAKLVCCDANFALPFADNSFDCAFCHDAFYFLPEKRRVAAELGRTTGRAILIGHAHNADAENFSSGAAISVADYAALFENPVVYDDAELTAALIENRAPRSQNVAQLSKTEAVAFVSQRGGKDNGAAVAGAPLTANFLSFDFPPPNRKLRVNPLLDAGDFKIARTPRYPSARYENEYAALSNYLTTRYGAEEITVREREMLLAGRWADEKNLRDLVRRRIFLDLPEKW